MFSSKNQCNPSSVTPAGRGPSLLPHPCRQVGRRKDVCLRRSNAGKQAQKPSKQRVCKLDKFRGLYPFSTLMAPWVKGYLRGAGFVWLFNRRQLTKLFRNLSPLARSRSRRCRSEGCGDSDGDTSFTPVHARPGVPARRFSESTFLYPY